MRRLSIGLLVVACAALFTAMPVAAKEGVRATLTTNVPLDAKPGTKLDVGWTLSALDQNGQRQPFGAGGVFVRLLSASGAGAETGWAGEKGLGEYAATVVVPNGGIGDIRIGIKSWTNGPSGTRESDWMFPITNDPLPGPARIIATPSSRDTGNGSTLWVVVVAGFALFALCLVAIGVVRRKRMLPA